MLIGSFEHMLDAKGRVFIPAKWRDTLGETIILTLGVLESKSSHCLFGMSVLEWETFSEKLARLPVMDVSAQAVRRRLYSMAAACEIDKQGRILIPPMLRDAAGLEKDATLIGVGDRIEFWNPAALNRYNEVTDEAYDAALCHLAEMGI
ncbi:MAG: division/cell wall cluster transcriptional repressor MraZ [Clostridia bacterium]